MLAIGTLEGLLGSKSVVNLSRNLSVCVLTFATAMVAWTSFEYLAVEEDFRVARFDFVPLRRFDAIVALVLAPLEISIANLENRAPVLTALIVNHGFHSCLNNSYPKKSVQAILEVTTLEKT
jgi:hypothetical protein